ncbi:MAG: hypothetical protein KGK01_13770 [Bradyrhizobium sp.]|uniref:hypothetical protein n=1 Tax=Bradyrhizobium sp. TaxID=376 RepID=UPI001C29772B|nr:hypothetical protein [Bradyrhizobium sp.]MBU6461593.1 hypothetical protein [Pseudomonadota bacterium]MDE2066703.1 hypothetical protein [Bradyrhizobium sp.]MDE2243449.1 hypothetical protein [Bradyrhizobium sp.]MDE2472783.1 hypothetical protein [Bradyrhizobium sp.]
MLEFDTNTLAFMTAALEQSSKKLRKDSPEARKFIANRLTACARAGGKSMAVFYEAGEMAVDELDSSTIARWWRRVLKLVGVGNSWQGQD